MVRQHVGMLDGMIMRDLMLTQPTRHRTLSFERPTFIHRDAFATVSFALFLPGYGWDWLNELRCSNQIQIATLGPGRVCPYCGDYNPAGSWRCWRCAGTTREMPNIKVGILDCCLSSIDVQPITLEYDDSPIPVTIEMTIANQDVDELVQAFVMQKATFNTLPNNLRLETGYYLCVCCGQAVREGCICPSCGGVRLPWQEILELERECIYCGNEVRGGIVCAGCGSRIAGTVYREIMIKTGGNR